MNLSATYTFDAPRQAVWDLLIDPTVIADCMPGCETFEPTGEDTYRATLTVGVGAITGRYEGTVAMVDKQAPSSYRLIVDGTGRAGFARGEAEIVLTDQQGRTLVDVVGHAQVGGTVARVGQRLLGSVSKLMMNRFFACLSKKAAGPG